MKASEIRILPALDPGESYVEPTFVLVETALDESGEPVTTIEHVASRIVGEQAALARLDAGAIRPADARVGARVGRLVRREPRSADRLPSRRLDERALRRYVERAPRSGLERVEIVARQAQLLLGRLGSIDDGAKRRVLGAILRIPRQVLARDADTRDLAIERV